MASTLAARNREATRIRIDNRIVLPGYQDWYSLTGRDSRQWRITSTRTGWRLEFRDPGDEHPTYAGTHPTLIAARREACR